MKPNENAAWLRQPFRGSPLLMQRLTKRCEHVRICAKLLTVALLMATNAAWSACAVSTLGINFGSYDPFFQQNLDSTGSVEVSCDAATAYSIALSPGRGAYTSRAMANGNNELFYNLYTSVTHATVWGDGIAGTATVDASGMGIEHTVYGSIPARQNAFSGNYSDTIVVTLTF
jgi:spore coat protein U-like protein